ncbi:MAG: flavodoxin family protein [Bacteroidales bacterium]
MKVVAINGSPKKEGNTYHAIKLITEQLEKQNIEIEIIHIGNKVIRGCMGCGQCAKKKDEKCIYSNDEVNECIQKMKIADGIILGSPVYFSGITGTMKSFLDRAFYVAGSNDSLFRHKVGVSVIADRRAGAVVAFSQLNNYINYAEMFMPSSNYWNVTFGTMPGEVLQDNEGVQIMRILGKNMAWLMKSIEQSKKENDMPERENKIRLNYIH